MTSNRPFQAGKYPWIAAFTKYDREPGCCAGTLVAAEWIVTAAHCVSPITKDNLTIVLGEYHLSSATDGADKIR